MELPKPIIFFDGVCNLCNGFVSFMVRVDSKQQFFMAPLQGANAQKRLPSRDINKLSSVVLVDGAKTYYKSEAVFQIFKTLGGPYSLLLVFKLLPRALTDGIYDLIARNRYKVFGQKSTCRIPTESEQKHFLD